MEDMELDLITLEDDGGNEIDMQVLDYMYYEGKEYALMTEYREDDPGDGTMPLEVLVMEVRAVEDDDEMEEFVPIDDELGEKLVKLFETKTFEDDEFEDEDEE